METQPIPTALHKLAASIYKDISNISHKHEFNGYDELDSIQKLFIRETIQLNNVLLWHSMNNRNKYSHFEIINGSGFFIDYDGDDTQTFIWDLTIPYLHEQSESLIEYLAELI